jgi:hypothetical protein
LWSGDVLGLHRVLTGLDRDSIEMREVSPMSGLFPKASVRPFSTGRANAARDQLERAIRTASARPPLLPSGSGKRLS